MDSSKKKKILIVNKSFVVGGIQSSMLNMINSLKDDYDIDLCVFNNAGQLKDRLPEGINVIKTNKLLQLHGMSVGEAKNSGVFVYLARLFLGGFARLFTNKLFFNVAMMLQKPLKGYDAAIAYHHEDSPNAVVSGFYRFVSKKTDAPIKLGWIHYDPYKVSFDDRRNEKYMGKMTKIVCVSKGTADIFKKRHPDLKVPVDYCYNMQDIGRIQRLKDEKQEVPFSDECFNCFSACRLTAEKALVRGIKALAPVLREHKDIFWYIAGDGAEKENIEAAIKSEGLDGRIILLGRQSNPYSYMKNSDLLMSLSFHEAAPMVYMEAKALHVPVFSTRTSSTEEMLNDGVEDFICENSEEGIRESFSELMNNREKLLSAKKSLESYKGSNDISVAKIAELMG